MGCAREGIAHRGSPQLLCAWAAHVHTLRAACTGELLHATADKATPSSQRRHWPPCLLLRRATVHLPASLVAPPNLHVYACSWTPHLTPFHTIPRSLPQFVAVYDGHSSHHGSEHAARRVHEYIAAQRAVQQCKVRSGWALLWRNLQHCWTPAAGVERAAWQHRGHRCCPSDCAQANCPPSPQANLAGRLACVAAVQSALKQVLLRTPYHQSLANPAPCAPQGDSCDVAAVESALKEAFEDVDQEIVETAVNQ